MKRVVLNRNGQVSPQNVETSDLKPAPSQAKYWSDLTAIAQTVAILGEGMKISRELATAAQNATGI